MSSGVGAAGAKAGLEAGGEAPAVRAPPDTGVSESPAKIPFKVRFKAWWEGVDPAEMSAGALK